MAGLTIVTSNSRYLKERLESQAEGSGELGQRSALLYFEGGFLPLIKNFLVRFKTAPDQEAQARLLESHLPMILPVAPPEEFYSLLRVHLNDFNPWVHEFFKVLELALEAGSVREWAGPSNRAMTSQLSLDATRPVIESLLTNIREFLNQERSPLLGFLAEMRLSLGIKFDRFQNLLLRPFNLNEFKDFSRELAHSDLPVATRIKMVDSILKADSHLSLGDQMRYMLDFFIELVTEPQSIAQSKELMLLISSWCAYSDIVVPIEPLPEYVNLAERSERLEAFFGVLRAEFSILGQRKLEVRGASEQDRKRLEGLLIIVLHPELATFLKHDFAEAYVGTKMLGVQAVATPDSPLTLLMHQYLEYDDFSSSLLTSPRKVFLTRFATQEPKATDFKLLFDSIRFIENILILVWNKFYEQHKDEISIAECRKKFQDTAIFKLAQSEIQLLCTLDSPVSFFQAISDKMEGYQVPKGPVSRALAYANSLDILEFFQWFYFHLIEVAGFKDPNHFIMRGLIRPGRLGFIQRTIELTEVQGNQEIKLSHQTLSIVLGDFLRALSLHMAADRRHLLANGELSAEDKEFARWIMKRFESEQATHPIYLKKEMVHWFIQLMVLGVGATIAHHGPGLTEELQSFSGLHSTAGVAGIMGPKLHALTSTFVDPAKEVAEIATQSAEAIEGLHEVGEQVKARAADWTSHLTDLQKVLVSLAALHLPESRTNYVCWVKALLPRITESCRDLVLLKQALAEVPAEASLSVDTEAEDIRARIRAVRVDIFTKLVAAQSAAVQNRFGFKDDGGFGIQMRLLQDLKNTNESVVLLMELLVTELNIHSTMGRLQSDLPLVLPRGLEVAAHSFFEPLVICHLRLKETDQSYALAAEAITNKMFRSTLPESQKPLLHEDSVNEHWFSAGPGLGREQPAPGALPLQPVINFGSGRAAQDAAHSRRGGTLGDTGAGDVGAPN